MHSPNIILLSASRAESDALRLVLDAYVTLTPVSDLPGLESLLDTNDCDAIFCGRSFCAGAWDGVLAELQERRPELPVIIFGDNNGLDQWDEAVEAGAFDLLEPPYRKGTVIPVMEHAIASREARRWHDSGMGETKMGETKMREMRQAS